MSALSVKEIHLKETQKKKYFNHINGLETYLRSTDSKNTLSNMKLAVYFSKSYTYGNPIIGDDMLMPIICFLNQLF